MEQIHISDTATSVLTEVFNELTAKKREDDGKIIFMAQVELDPATGSVTNIWPYIKKIEGERHYIKAMQFKHDRFEPYKGEDPAGDVIGTGPDAPVTREEVPVTYDAYET